MKAIVIEHRGEAGSLKEIPVPSAASHDVLVRVTAAGVNPIDWKRRERDDRPFPFVLGQDFAGVVSATGDRVTKYREGERVFGISARGAFAQYTLVPEDGPKQPMAKIPDSVGDADAAALPTAGLTALAGVEALHVAKGTTLLVLGATGGVGSYAVQIAHDRGARVIGSAHSSNEERALRLGVDEFVAYDREDVGTAVKAAHPEGVDAVLDLVDDTGAIEAMAQVLRDGGAIVSTIGAADERGSRNERLPRRTSIWPTRRKARTPDCERCWSWSNKAAYASTSPANVPSPRPSRRWRRANEAPSTASW
ncbi:MAG TPA: NADP-dependent oxidoreductase [Candidatus Cybelea sp.]|jgi:NADPH:quinone reductase-like Zn-dependent oxidoreductase|nr:NADP-dependent oxidoreductase [Candidatus Cybelea sp.]